MSQIHIYIQEVLGGDKIVYTTNTGERPRELSDIREELNQLQVPSKRAVIRVCYGGSNVFITIAKPSSLGRAGDYHAAWVVIPSNSVYSAIQGKDLIAVIKRLEECINTERHSWSDFTALDVELDPVNEGLRSSNQRQLAYRLYDEGQGYASLLQHLVQTEYAPYKAVYFISRASNPSLHPNTATELTTPLKRRFVLRPPSDLGSVRLYVNGAEFKQPMRYDAGTRLEVGWENLPYDPVSYSITMNEDQSLTVPAKTDWRLARPTIKVTFLGKSIQDVRCLINEKPLRESYTQEEWEQGLTLSVTYPDYQGERQRLEITTKPIGYSFKKRQLSTAFLGELGFRDGELKVDGKPWSELGYQSEDWWRQKHSFELELSSKGASGIRKVRKLECTLLEQDMGRLKELFKQPKEAPVNTGGKPRSDQPQDPICTAEGEYVEALGRFKPRVWQVIALVCAISLLFNIVLLVGGGVYYCFYLKPKLESKQDVGGDDSSAKLRKPLVNVAEKLKPIAKDSTSYNELKSLPDSLWNSNNTYQLIDIIERGVGSLEEEYDSLKKDADSLRAKSEELEAKYNKLEQENKAPEQKKISTNKKQKLRNSPMGAQESSKTSSTAQSSSPSSGNNLSKRENSGR